MVTLNFNAQHPCIVVFLMLPCLRHSFHLPSIIHINNMHIETFTRQPLRRAMSKRGMNIFEFFLRYLYCDSFNLEPVGNDFYIFFFNWIVCTFKP